MIITGSKRDLLSKGKGVEHLTIIFLPDEQAFSLYSHTIILKKSAFKNVFYSSALPLLSIPSHDSVPSSLYLFPFL